MAKHYYKIYLVLQGMEYELYTLNNYDACMSMINNDLRPHFKKGAVIFRIKEFNVEIKQIIDIENCGV